MLHSLAHDPYGVRRKGDWSSQLPAEVIAEVADGQDEGRSRDGFTGHEPLDRTGFIHMGGRLYDPRLGRFLSPDPVVSEPVTGQGWNLYSYVGNSPMGRTDPSGYCYVAGPACPVSGAAGGGFTSQAATLTTRGVSISYSHALSVSWSYVPGRYGSYGEYGYGGYFAPRVSLVAIPQLSIWARERTVSLGQETAPADDPMLAWRDAASIGVGFIPFVGMAQSVVELVTGYDYIAGEAADRRLAAAGVLASVLSGGKAGIKAISRKVDDDWDPSIISKEFLGQDLKKPPMKRIHKRETHTTGEAAYSYRHWSKQSTEDIVRFLGPDQGSPFVVKPDGRIYDGNTRILVLRERGFDIDSLPRIVHGE